MQQCQRTQGAPGLKFKDVSHLKAPYDPQALSLKLKTPKIYAPSFRPSILHDPNEL